MTDENTCSVSDVDELRGVWGFSLHDRLGEEIAFFSYRTEPEARSAHKMVSAAAFNATAILPVRPAAKFWFSFLWPNIDPDPYKDVECPDWDEGRVNFGIDCVEQIAPVVPMIRMKAETLEQAIPEAHRHWCMGNMIAPYGRTPYGYMIHDAGGLPVKEFQIHPEN